MSEQELKVREKEEETGKDGEQTEVGRFYVPATDIEEVDDALLVEMDMPGVSRERVEIELDNNVLTVRGRIDFDNYQDLRPIYSEYGVGNYTRSFRLSSQIDRDAISASLADGVLSLRLPKAQEAKPRKIEVA